MGSGVVDDGGATTWEVVLLMMVVVGFVDDGDGRSWVKWWVWIAWVTWWLRGGSCGGYRSCCGVG